MLQPQSPKKPQNFALHAHETHVWQASLQLSSEQLRLALALLTPDEVQRATRFVFEKDRHRFIAARSFLRKILARYLHCEPAEICFTTNTHGKPAISAPAHSPTLQFNLSHSNELALCAITLNEAIGVDVESGRDDIKADELAARFFSPTESVQLKKLDSAQKKAAFFRLWTCKEAFSKALGEGLLYPLEHTEISVSPTELTKLLRVEGDAELAKEWSLFELAPAPGYAGAVVVKGPVEQLYYWYY